MAGINNSSVSADIYGFADAGDEMQDAALDTFLGIINGEPPPTPGEVAAAVAEMGISLDTAAKILSACGKTAEYVKDVLQAAR